MLTDLPGYVGIYQISPTGDIFSSYRKRMLKGWTGNVGYRAVSLYKNGKSIKHNVHVLLATTFLPNPNNLPEVNHKDGVKLNNDLINLEWISGSDNIRHAFTQGLTVNAACIDYEKVPALLQEVLIGTPLRDICQREGINETSSLRKLLLREAIRTGCEEQFRQGTRIAKRSLVQEQSHRVIQTTLQGVRVQTFASINEAARSVGKNPATIWKAITNHRTCLGFNWEKYHA